MPGLRDYLLDLGVGQSRPISRAAAVIRADLEHGPEYLAVIASRGRLDAAGLQRACDAFVEGERDPGRAGPLPELDPEAVAGFGSLFIGEGDLDRVADLYRFAVALAGSGRSLSDLLLRIGLQSNLVTGHHDFVREVLAARREVSPLLRWQLELDLLRPENGGDLPAWQTHLRDVTSAGGPAPLALEGDTLAFGAVRAPAAAAAAGTVDGPRVTVVMATFRPGPDLDVAVASIVAQTWRDLEILLVDDCSGEESLARLQDLARTDDRIRVLQMPVNGGTYAIRNRALREATGEFVTFQDDDDWSHPERIERQVRPLLADPALQATFSRSLRLTTDLHATYVGFLPLRKNESSLMVRRAEVLDRLGGFDLVRKSGDSEFSERLEAVFGDDATLVLDDVLAVVQLTGESLSRGDFRYRWKHPSREHYRQSFTRWHDDVRTGRADSRLTSVSDRPFPAPARLLGTPEPRERSADILVVSGVSADEPRHHGLGHELDALAPLGSVGLLASETTRYARMTPAPPARRTMSAVNAGRAHRWTWDVPGRARVVLVRDPELLMMAPRLGRGRFHAEQVIVVAGYPPRGRSGRLGYFPTVVDESAQALFGARVRWLPATATVAAGLLELGADDVAEPRPWAVAPPTSRRPVGRRSSTAAVVGTTFVETMVLDRPDPAELRAILGDAPSHDVRVRDDLAALRKMGRDVRWPASWLVHGPGDIGVVTMLDQLDIHVDVLFPTWGPFLTWSTVAALARGAVPVVDPALREVLGDAALYAPRSELGEVVATAAADVDLLASVQAEGRLLVQDLFSTDTIRATAADWLASTTDPGGSS